MRTPLNGTDMCKWRQFIHNRKIFISALLIVLILVGCFLTILRLIIYVANIDDIVISGYEVDYDIDTQTILDQISHDNTGAFSVRKSALYFADKTPLPPVSWTQEDFFLVADALNRTIRAESLKEWQLDEMNYRVGECANASFGIQEALLDYFTVIGKNKDGRDMVNFIRFEIFPRYEIITYDDTVESIFGFSGGPRIDTTRITIPADVALNKAEDNGGRAFRESINNNCEIHIMLNQFFWKYEWQVVYGAFSPYSDKIFLVDAQSGKVSIGK